MGYTTGFMNLGTGIYDTVSVGKADTIVTDRAEALMLADLKTYPNPTSDMLSIQSAGLSGQSIRLETLTG